MITNILQEYQRVRQASWLSKFDPCEALIEKEYKTFKPYRANSGGSW